MPTENDSNTTPNPFLAVVDQVWEQRDAVATARQNYADARKANDETHTAEIKAVRDAREVLDRQYNEAREAIRSRERAANDALNAANKAALEAVRAALPTGYEINEWDY